MTTLARTRSDSFAGLLPVLAAALLGATLVFVGGFAQAAVLHDAAHDVRHTVAFPCH